MGESNVSAGKGSKEQTTDVTMDNWLQNFVQAGVGTAGGALSNLENLTRGNLVADFTPDQLNAMRMARDTATGANAFLPTAQEQFLNTAQGMDASQWLDPSAYGRLTEQTSFGNYMDPQALAALRSTAGGDYLYGGEGFDRAVNASMNAAMPQIASAFGGTAGGLSGALSRQAVGDTAVDAYARQYAQERANQLNAAQTLGGYGQADRRHELQAANLLGNFGNMERGRALDAAQFLPQIGMAGANILGDVGAQQQALAQQQLTAPLQAYGALAQLAMGVPSAYSPLFGSQQEGSYNDQSVNIGWT